MMSTRTPAGPFFARPATPWTPRLESVVLALLVLAAGFNLPLLEHGHGLDETHHHGCSACRLADAAAGFEAPASHDLGAPDATEATGPARATESAPARIAPDPLLPRAPPAA
jgi:hypothetical protein